MGQPQIRRYGESAARQFYVRQMMKLKKIHPLLLTWHTTILLVACMVVAWLASFTLPMWRAGRFLNHVSALSPSELSEFASRCTVFLTDVTAETNDSLIVEGDPRLRELELCGRLPHHASAYRDRMLFLTYVGRSKTGGHVDWSRSDSHMIEPRARWSLAVRLGDTPGRVIWQPEDQDVGEQEDGPIPSESALSDGSSS